MPNFSDSKFLSANNSTQIHVRRCTPDTGIRGIVQLSHGISEHIRRYDAFASFLAEQGFLVVGNDHLGHGESVGSDKTFGFFDSSDGWNLAVEDMYRLYQQTKKEYPELPYFLFGHSMGSFLARTFLIQHPDAEISGAILCGTAQPGSGIMRSGRTISSAEIARRGKKYRSQLLQNLMFGSYNNGIENKQTDYDWLTRDADVVKEYIADPLCGGIPTAGLANDMLNGMIFNSRRVKMDEMNHKLPVFFISGDKDPVGDSGKGVLKIYTFFLNAGMEDVTLKLYHNARHELLNELNKDQVMQDILQWMQIKM